MSADISKLYREIQDIYVKWNAGRLPMLGFVHGIEELIAAHTKQARLDLLGELENTTDDNYVVNSLHIGKDMLQLIDEDGCTKYFELSERCKKDREEQTDALIAAHTKQAQLDLLGELEAQAVMMYFPSDDTTKHDVVPLTALQAKRKELEE